MKKVPFFDYPQLYTSNQKDFLRIFDEVSSRGAYILQKEVIEFEKAIADFCNVKHAIGVANATDALEIAFFLSGIEKGDEVIMPSYGFVSVANAVVLRGAKPVFADIDPNQDYLPTVLYLGNMFCF